MNRSALVFVLAGLLLFLAGFALGRYVAVQPDNGPGTAEGQQPETVYLSDGEPLPSFDVTGADIDGLPRYPGSVRVEYRYVVVGDLAETEVEYIVADELNAVHDFYRQVFNDEGWVVADVGIYQGEWTFFIVSGEREAILELESRQSLIEIEIELSEPYDASAAPGE